MATITVMKNYVMKKAQSSSDENLKKIGKVLKNYAKLSAEDKKKVGSAVEKLYTKFKAQETKALAPKKSASAPKTSGSKKKIATQDLKSVIAKFKEKVGAKVWKQATSGTTSVKQDAERPALPKGKRFSKITGKPYWENRANRSDVKQPPKTYPRLAKGGKLQEIELGDLVNVISENKSGVVSNVISMGKHFTVKFPDGSKNVYDKNELKKIDDSFAKGGKMKYADGDITDMGGLQFIEWKGEEIMYEPTYKEYFFNDRKYMSLESAKKAVEKAVSGGGADQSHLRGAYSRGLFAKGGEVGTIGKFKYEITMANNIEGPFVIAKFIAKGDALICLNALQKATSTKGMRYTLKEVK